MNKQDIYKEAILKYGKSLQLIVAIEELSELQKEITKALRGKLNIDHLIEEIADAQIMIEQLLVIFGLETEEIEREKNYKISRLYERIKVQSQEDRS